MAAITLAERHTSATVYYHQFFNEKTMNLNRFITFIDVEASGLHADSYPIEIGWADTLGNSDSFLIRPPDHWTYWDNSAEALHGIKREQLLKEGMHVIDAAERLDQALGLETVFCDAIEFDSFWLMRLFEEADMDFSFQLADVHQLYGALGTDLAARMKNFLNNIAAPHRAREDAMRYAEAYYEIIEKRHR